MSCLRRNTTLLPLVSKRLAFPFPAQTRGVATAVVDKKEGDISDAFTQLAGAQFEPLDVRYAHLKTRLIAGKEDAVQQSWLRLLKTLDHELPLIASLGSRAIPEIDFADVDKPSEHFHRELKKRGCAVIRNVVPENEALQFKADIQAYISKNPHTKAFPADNPQVFELYWSSAQLRARSHPNLLKAQRSLMQHWHSADPAAPISSAHPITYADRLRIRLPGDNKFALGPHIDGGSVERWEEGGYGLGNVYDHVFAGRWELLDPWESSCRLPIRSDLYQGNGTCSMLRMFQGWLGMSHTRAGEGTLLVAPLLRPVLAYMLLRPFFAAVRPDPRAPGFLDAANWRLRPEQDAWLQGAAPGRGQELTSAMHPHLALESSMVHVPDVRPGDYVAWHCDTAHAVDTVHAGAADSSVLYIPACPLTPANAAYLRAQRDAFVNGRPGPDFPGGEGEARHVGRELATQAADWMSLEGMRAFGLEKWDSTVEGLSAAQREVMDRANTTLGFY